MSKQTSFGFRKNISSKPNRLDVAGCKASIQNNQLLTSTGIPSLDNILGGGLPVGSVILLEEDIYHNYSDVVLRYFMSEAVATRQNLFVSSAMCPPHHLIHSIPAVADSGGSDRETGGPADNTKMSIAWRYQQRPTLQPGEQTDLGHSFDLTKTMTPEDLAAVEISTYYPSNSSQDSYGEMLCEVDQLIESRGYSTTQQSESPAVLRLAVQSLGSPLWPTHDAGTTIPQFLYTLRSMLRYSFTVAMVTIPMHLLTLSERHTARCLCDVAVRLDSFAGSDRATNPLYKDYNGLFHLTKRPCINSLTYPVPLPQDLAFKLRRKKFTIEKLHLPPDLSETVSRSQGQTLTGCGSIDF